MEHQVTTSLANFPFEITVEILVRLRVKTLLRFRAVCKEWCNVIDSTYFLNLHLSRSIKNEMDRSVIITDKCRKSVIFSVDLKSHEEAMEFNVSWWPEDRLYVHGGVTFNCSCNGLLCLSSSGCRDIALWNPSTRKHLLLPRLIFDDDLQLFDKYAHFRTVVGFGFDFSSDDYKVVSVNEQYDLYCELVDTEVKVYSLKSNLWQRVHGFPQGHIYLRHGIFFKEYLHWLARPKPENFNEHENFNYYSIVAFDLTTHEIQIFAIPFSRNDWTEVNCSVHIGTIEGCLSAYFFEIGVVFDIWIQKEHGREDSWTKLISIHDPDLVSLSRLCLYPIFYNNKNSEILLIAESNGSPSEVIWHNFGSQCTRKVPIRGLPEYFYGDKLMMESLVRLDGFGH